MTVETEQKSPTLGNVLDGVFGTALAGLHTAFPAVVVSYDKADQRASVQPLIRSEYLDENGQRVVEDLPIIEDVPVIFPGSGGMSITFPITKGDTLLVICSESAISKWLEAQNATKTLDPGEYRKHSLSDAMAIPGLRNFRNPTDQVADDALIIASDDIRLGGKDVSDRALLVSEFNDFLTRYNAHGHPYNPGPSPVTLTLPIQTAETDASGSQKVKLE